jgi:plasmid stability protein
MATAMRQLITRLDDDLHRRLKERARREKVSMNAYVTTLLREAVNRDDAKARLRDRLREAGVLVTPPVTGTPPSRDEVIEQLRGAADVVLGAIEAGRRPR